jgi:hypothetical protein
VIRSPAEFENALAAIVTLWRRGQTTHESAMEQIAQLLKEQGK